MEQIAEFANQYYMELLYGLAAIGVWRAYAAIRNSLSYCKYRR